MSNQWVLWYQKASFTNFDRNNLYCLHPSSMTMNTVSAGHHQSWHQKYRHRILDQAIIGLCSFMFIFAGMRRDTTGNNFASHFAAPFLAMARAQKVQNAVFCWWSSGTEWLGKLPHRVWMYGLENIIKYSYFIDREYIRTWALIKVLHNSILSLCCHIAVFSFCRSICTSTSWSLLIVAVSWRPWALLRKYNTRYCYYFFTKRSYVFPFGNVSLLCQSGVWSLMAQKDLLNMRNSLTRLHALPPWCPLILCWD